MEQQVMNFGVLKDQKNFVLLLVFVPQDRVSSETGWSQTSYVAFNFLFELGIPLPLLPESGSTEVHHQLRGAGDGARAL